MGGREAGGLAHLLPGYRLVGNAEHRAEVETGLEAASGPNRRHTRTRRLAAGGGDGAGRTGPLVGGSHQSTW